MNTIRNGSKTISDNLISQAKNTSLLSLVETRIELNRESNQEHSGPCPKCGGADRFHCTAQWFFCRQCHDQRGDVIEFVQWIDGANFREAVQKLTGEHLQGSEDDSSLLRKLSPTRKEDAAPTYHDSAWQRKAQSIVTNSHRRLIAEGIGQAGRSYLLSRGLQSETWKAYGIGFAQSAPLPGTKGKQRKPAIVIPWFVSDILRGVRYRFLKEHRYKDSEGRQRQSKQTALYGSSFSGVLYGDQAVMGCAEGLRTLFIVEGELNALSCWQVGHDTGIDILSIGSESTRLSQELIAYANDFRHVIAWADSEGVAANLRSQIPAASAMKSPRGLDANDLLQQGNLGALIGLKRLELATTSTEKERLLWDLWDAAQLRADGLDTGTAQVVGKIANELGLSAPLTQIESGRWTSAQAF